MDVLPHNCCIIALISLGAKQPRIIKLTLSLKRHLSGTEFIEDDAKGVNVTTLIARKTKCLLW